MPLSNADLLLTEKQTVDLIAHSSRWLGRTVTLKIYPYDNGHTESYVACLEPCNAANADQSIVLIYTKLGRFKGYQGDKGEVVKAKFMKICPEEWPLCLDAPFRAFALHEND